MSDYSSFLSLDDLDSATPLDAADPVELAKAIRQIKQVMKVVLAVSLDPSGAIRDAVREEIAGSEVTETDIADDSIGSQHYKDLSVLTEHIGNLQITSGKLADDAVTLGKLADQSIHGAAFRDGTIPLAALAAALTSAEISSSVSDNNLRAITGDHIQNQTITDRAIKNVNFAKLLPDSSGTILYCNGTAWTAANLAGALTYNESSEEFEFGNALKVAKVGDVKSRGADGGGAPADSWTVRSLGEISGQDPDDILSILSNIIVFEEAGTYLVEFFVPGCGVEEHQARLVVDQDGGTTIETVLWGSSEFSDATGDSTTWSKISGLVVVPDNSYEYYIEHYTKTANATVGFGKAASSDNTTPLGGVTHGELYTHGTIIKLA